MLLLCLAGMLTACVSDDGLFTENTEGTAYGRMDLSLSTATSPRQTRATLSNSAAQNFLVTVYQFDEVVRGPQTLGTIDMTFPVGGGYAVYVENCTAADAESANSGWGQKHLTGKADGLRINLGETTTVKVNMSVFNASLCVIIDSSVSTYFNKSFTLTITDGDRTLVWNYDNAGKVENGTSTNGQVAFFNLGTDGTREISYTIRAEGDSETMEKSGTVTLNTGKNTPVKIISPTGGLSVEIDTDKDIFYEEHDVTLE